MTIITIKKKLFHDEFYLGIIRVNKNEKVCVTED